MTKLTIYTTDERKARAERLARILADQGIPGLRDNKGNPSLSGLFDHLVRERLAEIDKKTKREDR